MRLLKVRDGVIACAFSVGLAVLALVGCAGPGTGDHHTAEVPPANTDPADQNTPLQVSDRIQVELTGTPVTIAPLVMDISEKGTITLPLLDKPIQAEGKSPQQLEETIRTNYMPAVYLHVNVTVTTLQRYFIVSGEINQGGTGRVPYLGKITIIGAISAAGGFNDYAARHRVIVNRWNGKKYKVDCIKAISNPSLDIEILPGDRIIVPRRTFWEALFGK